MHRKLIVSLTLNILLFGIILGTVFVQKSKPEIAEIIPTPSVSVAPSQSISLSPSVVPVAPTDFQQFVELFGYVVPLLEQGDYEQLTQIQAEDEVTCDALAPYNPSICEGQPDGTVTSGWLIGYEASEGSLYSQEQFIATLTQYAVEHGPFTYGSNRIEGNHGSITLYNPDRQWKLAVVISKDNPENLWRVEYTLLGLNLEQQ